MKIVLASNTAWSIANFRKNLIKMLIDSGHEVHTIAPADDKSQTLVDLGTTYHDVKMKPTSKNPFNDLILLADYYKLLKQIKPDATLTFTIKPNLYISLINKLTGLGGTVIPNITGLGNIFMSDGVAKVLVQNLYKFSFEHLNTILFQNNDDLTLFTQNSIIKETQAIRVNGSGVDLETLKNSKPYPNTDPVKLIFVARMLWDKGTGTLANALNLLKEKGVTKDKLQCMFVGKANADNPNAISLDIMQSWEQQNELIKYVGHVDNIPELMAECNAIVLPSYYREGVPRSLLEGGAMGLPIITTDNVGCKETVINGKNGYIVPIKDHVALADAILKFMHLTYEEKKEMGKQSRILMESQFDERTVLNTYKELLAKI